MTDKAIKGVLFDLDGVLIDTEGTYTQFWEAVDRRFPTGVEGFAQVIKGSNLHNILHSLAVVDEDINAEFLSLEKHVTYMAAERFRASASGRTTWKRRYT